MELGTNRLKPPEKAERKTIRSPKAFSNSLYRPHYLVFTILDFWLLFQILGFLERSSRWTCTCDSCWVYLGATSYQIENEHPHFSQLPTFHIDIICDLAHEGLQRKTLPQANQRNHA